MKIIESPASLREEIASLKKQGYTVGFVPTMGFLHEGHLALMREAKRTCDRVVISIFVNPRQFGANEDLDKYPRNIEGDTELAEKEGVDILFFPPVDVIYPQGYQTNVSVPEISKGLCGASRPGHFDGVATIITKLFNLVDPDVAVFGEKDFQQLAVIRRLTQDLNFSIKIIGHPIVRERDGLAMSSRNKYLDENERREALCLYRSLQMAKHSISRNGACQATHIVKEVRDILESANGCTVDYINLVNPVTLEAVDVAHKGDLLAIAVYINNHVRLIDNTIL